MNRFTTFLDKIKLPGVTTTSVIVALGEPDSYLWWGDRVFSRPTHIGFDSSQEKFFTFSALIGKKQSAIPAHLQKVPFLEEGKITNLQAASSFVTLWLQHLANKRKVKGFQLVSGRYVIPCGLSEAQRQIYEQVFSQIEGSWTPLASESALMEAITLSDAARQVGTIIMLDRRRTDILILTERQLQRQRTIPLGVVDLMTSIDRHLREQYQVVVDEATITQLYQELSRITALPSDKRLSIRGKDVTTNLPQNVVVELQSFTNLISEWLASLVREVKIAYSQLSPDELARLSPQVVVVGSGGHFRAVQTLLRETFQVTVMPFEQPELAVIKGARHVA